jgi:hypothetical protein
MSIRSCLTGPEIQRLPFPDHVWTCAQDHLETILARCAVRGGTQLRYGSQLTGLEPADGAVLATVAAQGSGSSTIRAQYVVGADGAHSSVRQASGIGTSRVRGYGHWISILFRSSLRDYTGDEPCMVYGIGDPSPDGVFVPTDATDRWNRTLPTPSAAMTSPKCSRCTSKHAGRSPRSCWNPTSPRPCNRRPPPLRLNDTSGYVRLHLATFSGMPPNTPVVGRYVPWSWGCLPLAETRVASAHQLGRVGPCPS